MSLGASSKPRVHGRTALAGILALSLVAGVGACSSNPPRSEPQAQPPVSVHPAPDGQVAAATQASAATGTTASPAPAAGGPNTPEGAAPAPKPEVPDQARQDFEQAVVVMRAGNASQAQLDFSQLAASYPQFAAPLVNLAILQRKDGHLDQAEDTLKQATARESGNAIAWSELGVTQRLRGEFQDARASYQRALAADPRYAPAWRNLGVLSDLYLGDPENALKDFEQYKELTGEDKPVSGWIAELRQRLGMPPIKRPAPGESAPGTPDASPTQPPGSAPAETPPGGTPEQPPSQGAPAAPGA
jgi:tetratricopeptide (TPR) repeat protein